MPKSFGRLLWISLVGLIWVAQALAQGGATGAISGTVLDPSGAVVAGAEVRIINQDTGFASRSIKTDASGSFTATLLPAGTYTVDVSSSGFQEAKFTDVAVRVTETTRMEAKLRTLAVQEKVEVQAQVQTVETSTATTGQAVESKTIRDLPLATQNFQQLLTLSSGAQSELNASAQLGRGNVRVFVNGQREDNNNLLIEGISATDYNVAQATNVPLPNPDVIQEFKVQTSLYDASQGRNGGGDVNAILKSGTKNFHGDLYEFFRNDVLNANEYFLNRAGQPRPSVKQNIFGGSFGGPIGGSAKGGYFFVNYQGTRQRSGLSPGTFISSQIPLLPSDRSPGKSGRGVQHTQRRSSNRECRRNRTAADQERPVSQCAGISDSLRNRRPKLRSGLHPRSGPGDRRGEYRPVHREQAGALHGRSIHRELGPGISRRQ